jgi:thiol:disulfide interchange protein DsbC
MDTQRDITQSRLDEKTKVEWNSLPLSASFAVKKGNGSRHVAVFTDPECPYCTKLEKEFAQMTDVTIHYFLMPLDMHPNAKPKADAIWCSTNKAKALSDVMDGQNVQNPKKGCVAPTADVLAFASQHGISGTPALIRHDGKLMPGFAPAAKLSEWLDGK